MENFSTTTPDANAQRNRKQFRRIAAGSVLLIAGFVWLAKIAGADLPDWLFTWPSLLILIGICNAVRHNFRGGSWVALIAVGTLFLLDHNLENFSIRAYLWPIIIIAIGISMMFKHGKHDYTHC